jgi:tetratricopeptide (TPR) repeat protein
VQLYRQALRMDGKFHMSRRYWGATLGDARWQISYPLRRLGQEDEAAEYARAAVKQEASPAARAALGDALRDIGDPAGAREQYRLAADNVQRLVAQKPKNMPARAQLADLYRRLGELSVRTRDLAAAKAWFTKELEVWTTWEKHGVSNSFRERQLVEATRRLGRLGA